MKTVKVVFNRIKKENIDYSKLFDAITTANKLIHINYLFIRGFLIHSFENKTNKFEVDEKFIRLGFKIIMNCPDNEQKQKGRPIEKNDEHVYLSMCEYWKIFSEKIGINNISYPNISYILNNSAKEIYTNIINNLSLHYEKHVYKCIEVYFIDYITKSNQTYKKYIRLYHKKICDKLNGVVNSKKNKDKYIPINFFGNCKSVSKFIDKFKEDYLPEKSFEIKLEKGIQLNTYDYLKSSYIMNKFIESTNSKMYQFFPIKNSFYDKHITINTSALIDLFICKHKSKALQSVGNDDFKKIVWNKYFNIYKNNKELIKYNKHIFNYEIQTNGYTVSINYIDKDKLEGQKKKKELMAEGRRKSNILKKNIEKNEFKNHQNKKISDKIDTKKINKDNFIEKKKTETKVINKLSKEDKFKIEYNKNLKSDFPKLEVLMKNPEMRKILKDKYDSGKLLLCDPGKNQLLYCINPNCQSDTVNSNISKISNYGISFSKDKKDKFMNYTNNTRLKFIKHHKYKKYTNKWKSKKINDTTETLQSCEEKVSNYNSKSCVHKSFLEYCKEKIKCMVFYKENYKDSFLQKLNWYMYLNKYKHINELIKIIKSEFGKDITIIIGDWSSTGKVKYMSTPNNFIKNKLKEHFTVYHIDEFRTSKYHNLHEIKCKNFYRKLNEKEIKIVEDKLKLTKLKIKSEIKSIHGKINDKLKAIYGYHCPFEIRTIKKVHDVLTFKKVDYVRNFPKIISDKLPVKHKTRIALSGSLNRDRNAVLNMNKIFIELSISGNRPEILTRTV